ncbi:hypothetical protein PR048_017488 [Dryococelus australis]|uniref:Uncharacterized protein n=1 Tax=Dryococelus australis TaxID=614101 RepID=A0ABQ9H9Q9_9NEOP|nr:hypothetical protein PR048_017488 [Dryococelus australis]
MHMTKFSIPGAAELFASRTRVSCRSASFSRLRSEPPGNKCNDTKVFRCVRGCDMMRSCAGRHAAAQEANVRLARMKRTILLIGTRYSTASSSPTAEQSDKSRTRGTLTYHLSSIASLPPHQFNHSHKRARDIEEQERDSFQPTLLAVPGNKVPASGFLEDERDKTTARFNVQRDGLAGNPTRMCCHCATYFVSRLEAVVYLELLSHLSSEMGRDKGYNDTRVIAATFMALNWRAVMFSCCVILWNLQSATLEVTDTGDIARLLGQGADIAPGFVLRALRRGRIHQVRKVATSFPTPYTAVLTPGDHAKVGLRNTAKSNHTRPQHGATDKQHAETLLANQRLVTCSPADMKYSVACSSQPDSRPQPAMSCNQSTNISHFIVNSLYLVTVRQWRREEAILHPVHRGHRRTACTNSATGIYVAGRGYALRCASASAAGAAWRLYATVTSSAVNAEAPPHGRRRLPVPSHRPHRRERRKIRVYANSVATLLASIIPQYAVDSQITDVVFVKWAVAMTFKPGRAKILQMRVGEKLVDNVRKGCNPKLKKLDEHRTPTRSGEGREVFGPLSKAAGGLCAKEHVRGCSGNSAGFAFHSRLSWRTGAGPIRSHNATRRGNRRFLAKLAAAWSSAGMKEQGKREIPEKIRRSAASSSTLPTCKNPGVTRPEIEPAWLGRRVADKYHPLLRDNRVPLVPGWLERWICHIFGNAGNKLKRRMEPNDGYSARQTFTAWSQHTASRHDFGRLLSASSNMTKGDYAPPVLHSSEVGLIYDDGIVPYLINRLEEFSAPGSAWSLPVILTYIDVHVSQYRPFTVGAAHTKLPKFISDRLARVAVD